ncbi:MAG: hypothetical protein DIU68_017520 [Chloroflexota bacterium]
MCGIFGIAVSPRSTLRHERLEPVLRRLFLLSEARGKDASGLALLDDDEIIVLKNAVRARALLGSRPFEQALASFRRRGAHLAMGHARMVTNGSETDPDNNQPVIKNGLVCIHNGIIVNDAELWAAFPALERRYEVDTEVILSLFEMYRAGSLSPVDALIETFRCLRGANSVALLPADLHGLLLATSNGSLFYAVNDSALIFASERYILERIAAEFEEFAQASIVQLAAGNGCAFDLDQLIPQPFALNGHKTAMSLPAHAPRSVREVQPEHPARKRVVTSSPFDLGANDRFIQRVNDAVASLRRCTRCLLPETFPFIRFDEHGVCNFCRNYQPLEFKGVDTLRELLEPYRRSDGRPDCLVPLSGGRDSCYGLHYIKTELGMNPVAYTYDWGMVTDLARRNISRMCGALGVEHILVSADIRRKREFVRKNVSAWLKRPSLGTVPLFMAGDKQFFYYASLLRKQMNLGIVIFSMNRLERTDFKVGFCGIDETEAKQEKHYALSLANQARMIAYYGGEFLRNPAYLNTSLLDSASAFVSYYLIPKNFATLYDYLRWDEQTVEGVLLNEYDWETAPDTKTTWRIGDGTASFYNYIYYVMAGFSENDTFRSNQIREGMITREEGLARAQEDNQPRYDSIRWYCETIGLDFGAAIQRINQAPKRYEL